MKIKINFFNSNNNKILEKENKKSHRRLKQKLDMLKDKTPKISASSISKSLKHSS